MGIPRNCSFMMKKSRRERELTIRRGKLRARCTSENRRRDTLSLDVYLALYPKTSRRRLSCRTVELVSYTGIGLADGETVRAISAIVSVHCVGERARENTDTLSPTPVRLSPQQAGHPGVNYAQLSARSVASASQRASQPSSLRPSYVPTPLAAAYNEIRCYTVTIIITLVLTHRRRDFAKWRHALVV